MNMEMQTSISIFFILLSEKSRVRDCASSCQTEIADRISRLSSYFYSSWDLTPEPSLLSTIFSGDMENDADM